MHVDIEEIERKCEGGKGVIGEGSRKRRERERVCVTRRGQR